ncbi:glycosyltransferase [Phormidium tenue FACHB-886]|nr:glycosyltransferase [Phormidium tenue FACHB-886]
MKTVSVIIPCYNGERYLAEAIESALNQTYPIFELIVIDDGSTDSSKEIALNYAPVKYLYQQNQGVAAARNRAIADSSGEYVVLLDQDDRLLPNAIEIGAIALSENADWMFTVGPCRLIDEHGKRTDQGRKILEAPVFSSVYRTLLSGTCLNPPSRFMFRRTLFDTIGNFDSSVNAAEDYDFYLRAAALFSGYSHAQPVVEYREHGNSGTNQTQSARHLDNIFKIYAKQNKLAQRQPEDAIAHQAGLQHWIELYSPYVIYDVTTFLKRGQFADAATALYRAMRYQPQSLLHYSQEQMRKLTKKRLSQS